MTPTETHDDALAADSQTDSQAGAQADSQTDQTQLAATPDEQAPLLHEGDAHDHDHAGHTHGHAPTLNPELTHSIEVEAPVADVNKAFSKVVRRYTKLARIPGFRAGKVPESLIKSRFAREVRQEVLESLVSDRFRSALEGQSLLPVSQPQVTDLQLFEGQPLRFKATFEVLPEINIDGYDAVTIDRPDTALTDEEYEAELNAVLDHHATVEPVEEERALAEGDWAEISFEGKMQAAPQPEADASESAETPEALAVPEIKGDDMLLEVGGKNTLPAFSDALRGSSVGQELTFEVGYPAEFGDERLAGKTVDYDVKIKAIKRKTFPERNDEFAKELGNYDSWSDFESKLRERASGRKKDALETQARDSMLDQLINRFQFPVPETFVQQQIDARLERGLRALAQQGMSSDAMRQLDFNRLREAQRDQSVSEVKASLLLDRIAEREGVTVSDDDLERELLMLSMQQREPLDALRKRLTDDGALERIREQMRREKTGQALYARLAA